MAETENSFELVESRDAMNLVPQREIPVWWFAVGVFVILLIAGLVFLIGKSAKPVDPMARKRKAYGQAVEAFGGLGTQGVKGTAISVSAILRRYLADAMDEPALFETHEEFIARHDCLKNFPEGLKTDAGDFFSQLAEVKYAEQVAEGCDSGRMSEGGLKLLERMHAA